MGWVGWGLAGGGVGSGRVPAWPVGMLWQLLLSWVNAYSISRLGDSGSLCVLIVAVRMNDPGRQNGLVEVAVDGTTRISYDKVLYRYVGLRGLQCNAPPCAPHSKVQLPHACTPPVTVPWQAVCRRHERSSCRTPPSLLDQHVLPPLPTNAGRRATPG